MSDKNFRDISADDLIPSRSRILLMLKMESMLRSIETLGLIEPLVVSEKDENGKYRLRDGDLRYYVLKEMGVQTIPCVIEGYPSDTENNTAT